MPKPVLASLFQLDQVINWSPVLTSAAKTQLTWCLAEEIKSP